MDSSFSKSVSRNMPSAKEQHLTLRARVYVDKELESMQLVFCWGQSKVPILQDGGPSEGPHSRSLK